MYQGDYQEDYAKVNFLFATVVDGTMTAMAGTPAISVFKGNSTSQSTAGITLTEGFDSTTGSNQVLIDLSADAFYAVGEDYTVYLSAGTLGSKSVVGRPVATFSIENRRTEDVIALLPTALIGGRMDSDVEAINNDTDAADQLALSASMIQQFTIDNTSFTATKTQAQVDAVTPGSLEATDTHYKGRTIIFTSDANIYQATDITDYDGTNKRFTYTAVTDTPSDDGTFIVI